AAAKNPAGFRSSRMPAPTHGRLPATRGGWGSTAARRGTTTGPRLPGARRERRAGGLGGNTRLPQATGRAPCAPCREEKPSQISALNVFSRGASLARAGRSVGPRSPGPLESHLARWLSAPAGRRVEAPRRRHLQTATFVDLARRDDAHRD